ncbi:MAG: Maf family protein [Planctomycetota bacterium]|nr:Maf family protein [Planctomycetota bacterium]
MTPTRRAERRLILASASTARARLLEEAGYSFEVLVTDAEDSAREYSDPHMYCMERAIAKCRAAAGKVLDGVVVAADTVATLDDHIIGKPADEADAHATLRRLSRKPHEVVSALAVIVVPEGLTFALTDSTTVHMKPMNDREISEYISSGEAKGRAGSYAVQETGDRFVEKLEGSYTNVVGLPMEAFGQLLEILSNRGIFIGQSALE